MNEMKSIFSGLLMIGAVAGAMTLAACPGDNNTSPKGIGEACTLDADCESNTCEGDVCAAACDDMTACTGMGEECTARASGEGKYCKAVGSCKDSADPAAFCGEGKVCGDDGMCADAPKYKYIMIKDVTAGDADPATVDACKPDQGDFGSDIFEISLQNAAGETLGYGVTFNFTKGAEPDGGTNGYTDAAGVFTGNAPSVEDVDIDGTSYSCPTRPSMDSSRLLAENVVALGCGGTLIVSFKDSGMMDVLLEKGNKVWVSEFAPVCNRTPGMDAVGDDKYEVYLCSPDKDMVGPDDCQIALSDAAVGGYTQSEVTW